MGRREEIAESIIKFAQDNDLEIHPGQDPLKWADLVIKKGGCPCVPGRNHCPCEFVLEDMKETDHRSPPFSPRNRCRCGLFCNQAFIEEYNRLLAEWKSRRKWTPKLKVSS